MLNYIWAGLIVLAAVFALVADGTDLKRHTYQNDKPLPVTLRYKKAPALDSRQNDVEVIINAAQFRSHFAANATLPPFYPATILATDSGLQLRFAKNTSFPEPLATMQDFLGGDDKQLCALVSARSEVPPGSLEQPAQLKFERVWFVKLRAITLAAFDTAKSAVQLAIGLVGALALWLGLMKIGEASGLIDLMVKLVQPILRPLFPGVPKGHPAMGYIAVNLAGNILGLGNATTAMGLKAMEELQKLNPSDDTATDPMVMLLAIHTAAFQLVPSATLVAVMGFGAAEVFFPMLLVGFIATAIAVIAARVLGMMPTYRRTDPNRAGREGAGGIMSFREIMDLVSLMILPALIVGLPVYGLMRRVPVYEKFVEGAKDGFSTAIRILPYLVAILFAIAMFRASGAMGYVQDILRGPLSKIGFPPEVLPMAIIRPLTGSGSVGVLGDMVKQHGTDSIFVKMAATIYGSTETTFYVIAVYFGAVNIRKTRHALPVGIIADVCAILLAVYLVKWWFGP